jgi:hypothetical protein
MTLKTFGETACITSQPALADKDACPLQTT